MSHTLPDYTTKYKMTTIFGNIDTGEAAVRQGSIVIFDRRGQVIYLDDFEASVLKWQTAGSGTGWDVSLDTTRANSGSQCCKITTGSTDELRAEIYKTLPYIQKSRIGFSIATTTPSTLRDIRIDLELYDGSTKHRSGIMYYDTERTLGYFGQNGAYNVFTTTKGIYKDDYMFSVFKLVTDFENEKYVRFILNNDVYDLSSYTYEKTNDTSRPHLLVRYKLVSTGGTSTTSYVDDVILTQNEP